MCSSDLFGFWQWGTSLDKIPALNAKNEHGNITAQNFGGAKKNAITMQDKTGSYGQKRKPGDYFSFF